MSAWKTTPYLPLLDAPRSVRHLPACWPAHSRTGRRHSLWGLLSASSPFWMEPSGFRCGSPGSGAGRLGKLQQLRAANRAKGVLIKYTTFFFLKHSFSGSFDMIFECCSKLDPRCRHIQVPLRITPRRRHIQVPFRITPRRRHIQVPLRTTGCWQAEAHKGRRQLVDGLPSREDPSALSSLRWWSMMPFWHTLLTSVVWSQVDWASLPKSRPPSIFRQPLKGLWHWTLRSELPWA